MSTIEWHRSAEESRTGRWLSVVALAPLLGLVAVFLLSVLVAVVAGFGTLFARPEILLLVVVLALVGGPLSLLYLWPLLTDPEQRAGLATGDIGLSFSELLASTALGIVGHAISVVVLSLGPYLFVAAGTGGGCLLLALFSTAGRLDTEARTLSTEPDVFGARRSGREIDLTTWERVSRYRIGETVLLRCTYVAGHRGPRLLTLPAWVDEHARPVIEAAVRTERSPIERNPDRLVQVILVGFGALFGGLGGSLVWMGLVPRRVELPVLGAAGGIACLFLVFAAREG